MVKEKLSLINCLFKKPFSVILKGAIMKPKAVILLVFILSLLITKQSVAGDMLIEVTKVNVKFHPDGMILEHTNGFQCVRLSHMERVNYNNQTGRLSIYMYRGDTVHYDFSESQKYHGRVLFKRIAQGAFLGFDRKGSKYWWE